MIGWLALSLGFVKLNVDGVVDIRRNSSSCGGLIQNKDGDLLGGFYCNTGQCLVIETEL